MLPVVLYIPAGAAYWQAYARILSVCEPLVSVPVHVCMQYIKARPISIAGASFLVGSVCFH